VPKHVTYGAPDLNTATFVQRPNWPRKKKKRGSTQILGKLGPEIYIFAPKRHLNTRVRLVSVLKINLHYFCLHKMPYKKKSQQIQAAKAREGRALKQLRMDTDSELSDVEVTSWTGGVKNHVIGLVDSDSEFEDTDWESESSEDEIDGLQGDELVESLRKEVESEMELLRQAAETPYEKISNGNLTAKDWKRAEQNRGLGYDGHASRTQRKHSQNAREKAESDKIARKS